MMDDWNGGRWVNGRHVMMFNSRGHHERLPPLWLWARKFDGRRDVAILVLVALDASVMV